MSNLTRDPFHQLAQTQYVKNMSKLTVTVDGVRMNPNRVLNVYKTAHERKPYVEMLEDEDGKVKEVGGKYVTYEVEGKIEVLGVPRRCGCWKGRKIANWWRKLNDAKVLW